MSATTANATKPFVLLVAVCHQQEVVCPECGNHLLGRTLPKPDGVVVTCANRKPDRAGPRDHTCGCKVAVIPAALGPLCMVVRLPEGLFHRILADDRPLHEHFREANLIVRKVPLRERRGA